MHADFSVELGHDDPALEIPWASDDHPVRYYDLKSSPELILQIPEALAHPEIKAFLTRMNASNSPFETAKCDVWESQDITAEEEIFGADRKFASYIDLIFVDEAVRSSFKKNEEFAKSLCLLLGRAPDIAATIELVIRRCYYHHRPADRQDEFDRISSDRISKDVQQGTPDCQVIPLVQKPASSHDSKQYQGEKPQLRTDHVEAGSQLEPLGGLASGASVKPESPHVPGASLKSERPQGQGASLSSQDSTACDRHVTSGVGHLCAANIFLEDSKAFLHESTALNESSAVDTSFYLTAYVTGFGVGSHVSRSQWAIAISLLQHALMQCGYI